MLLQRAPLGARGESSGRGVGKAQQFTHAVSWSARLALILALALPCSALAAGPQRLWGVDEDQGELFSIEDYRQIPGVAAGLTSYGPLMFNGQPVGTSVDAFAADPNRIAYMVRNTDLGGTSSPVLFTVDLNNPSNPNVSIVGTIGVVGFAPRDNISGLAFHPRTGDLFAIWRRGFQVDNIVDHLLKIDPSALNSVVDLGPITGLGENVGSGEDLVFDPNGNLYLVDDNDDELYRIDPDNAGILAVVVNNVGSTKMEGLAWDPDNGQLLGTAQSDVFTILDVPPGSFTQLGALSGLTDVEGISFVPLCGDGVVDRDEQCDDGNTEDGDCCSSSCAFESAGSVCDDGDACTQNDTCDGSGRCTGPSLDCNDGNLCTDDACDPATGCTSIPNTDSCDDGDACTTPDT
ncbi:MAG: DUF4215 domain-containing protein, partial [Myxococcales bacterium]|nr:DUF4215 domain-containing protein [Myxococcales bacterium]